MPSKVQIDVVADVRRAADNLDSLDRKVGKLGDTFTSLKGRAGLAMKDLAIQSAISLGQRFSSDVIGAMGDIDRLKFTVTEAFGESGPMRRDLEAWSSEWSEKFGDSRLRVEELAASLALQFDQAGFTGEQMLEMATRTAEAGLAMSLFRKEIETPTQGAELITAALRGEKDALFNLIGDLELTGDAAEDLNIIIDALSEDFGFMNSEAAENQLQMNEIKSKYGELRDDIAEKLLPVLELVPPALDGIAISFEIVHTAGVNAIRGIRAVVDALRKALDGVVSAIGTVRDAFDLIPNPADIPGNIASKGKDLLGSIPGANAAKELLGFGASGAIVNRPTLSLIGEAGPEAVVPLSSTRGNSPLPMGGPIVVQLNVDGRTLAEVVADASQAAGGLPFRVRAAG